MELTKIKSCDIKEGEVFSAPVFFDDGKNMFLAKGKAVKSYHINALKRWSIPYVLTAGHPVSNDELERLNSMSLEDMDLQPVDDLEPFDDIEPLDEVAGEKLFSNTYNQHVYSSHIA